MSVMCIVYCTLYSVSDCLDKFRVLFYTYMYLVQHLPRNRNHLWKYFLTIKCRKPVRIHLRRCLTKKLEILKFCGFDLTHWWQNGIYGHRLHVFQKTNFCVKYEDMILWKRSQRPWFRADLWKNTELMIRWWKISKLVQKMASQY